MVARISSTHTLEANQNELTAELLLEFLVSVPHKSVVTVTVVPGGQLDPTVVRLNADMHVNKPGGTYR